MAEIPKDFVDLLPRIDQEHSDEPLYWLWVYDPQEDKVHVEHNEDRHRAEHVDHGHLAEKVSHPGRVHGYAYRIRGGFRITDWEHRAVDDPHIRELVRDTLGDKNAKSRTHHGSRSQFRAVQQHTYSLVSRIEK